MLYPKLRAALGLPARVVRVYDIPQQLAVVEEEVLDALEVDTIEMGRGFALEDRWWKEWTLPDGTPCLIPSWIRMEREPGRWVILSEATGRVIAHMPDGAIYFEQTYYPLLEDPGMSNLEDVFPESMWTAVASPPGPAAGDLAAGAKALRERQPDRAIVGLFGGNLLEMGQFFYRNDQFLLMLMESPDVVHDFLDRVVERHLRVLEDFLGSVGEYIDVILFGDDLGMQSGPQISPATYREYFKPRHARMWRRVKELADVKIMLHCCGGVRELLPDLIDAGLEAINPVQISCRGMETEGIKRDFGKDIVFWGGGCDTQNILVNSTPEQVAGHVREQIRTLAPGGGFVFQQVHNIQANVPVENLVAMFEAAARPWR